jgi:DOPA 4,5-dioxygenase
MIDASSAEPLPADITDWHAHVYYEAATLDQAIELCELADQKLPVKKGRVHEKLVGPHPMWSCQLSFEPGDFASVIVWLNARRQGLTVFVHPNTGDALVDHRDHAIWLGDSVQLKLDIFSR